MGADLPIHSAQAVQLIVRQALTLQSKRGHLIPLLIFSVADLAKASWLLLNLADGGDGLRGEHYQGRAGASAPVTVTPSSQKVGYAV
jgi:hypothetical protein